jgi:ATP-dependent RNA helicase DDX47/RRP3
VDYQKIEHNLGKKLDQYGAEESEVLIFYERVLEAERIADAELKKLYDKHNKLMKQLNDSDDDEKRPSSAKFGKKKMNGKEKRDMVRKKVKLDI